MIVLSHPFGNANVRAVLNALHDSGFLAKYVTALGWPQDADWLRLVPGSLREKLGRRGYALSAGKLQLRPMREIARLLAADLPFATQLPSTSETGRA